MTDDIEDRDDEQEGYHKFLLFWDIYGLESAVNIDLMVQRRTEAVLKEEKPTDPDLGELINMMKMRAQFNIDRQYEMYAVQLPAYYTQDHVHDMFAQDPQVMVDLVRSRGIRLMSNRYRPVAVIK
jgi:hypothetical protein